MQIAEFEAALAHLEQEAEEKDAEVEAANREIEQLGQRIYELEEEGEELKKHMERAQEDDVVEREHLEALVATLKEVGVYHFLEIHGLINFLRNLQISRLS
jgi:predicted  nucleic acid-binding Zn-ribbon protein